jgi:hypothetical protein
MVIMTIVKPNFSDDINTYGELSQLVAHVKRLHSGGLDMTRRVQNTAFYIKTLFNAQETTVQICENKTQQRLFKKARSRPVWQCEKGTSSFLPECPNAPRSDRDIN